MMQNYSPNLYPCSLLKWGWWKAAAKISERVAKIIEQLPKIFEPVAKICQWAHILYDSKQYFAFSFQN